MHFPNHFCRNFILLFFCLLLLSGCTSETHTQDYQSEWIVRQEYFVQIDAEGDELWFDDWMFCDTDATEATEKNKYFEVAGHKYEHGLGADGFTIDGPYTIGTSYINYELNNCICRNISGLYAFDDKTQIFSDSILTIYFDGQEVFVSDVINKDHRSVEINVEVPEDVKQIAFQFDTQKVDSDLIPKVVLVDLRAEIMPL